jgi:hypothetical protein
MHSGGGTPSRAAGVDVDARPDWMRTGYKFFPYAARQGEQWWVLRLNFDFPEHALYTVFIDGTAAVDTTGDVANSIPLVASIGALNPSTAVAGEPALPAEVAEAVVREVAAFVVHGSEFDDPCMWCESLTDADPMERD